MSIKNKYIRALLLVSLPTTVILGAILVGLFSGLIATVEYFLGIFLGITLGAIGMEYDRQILKGANSVFTGFSKAAQNEKLLRGVFAILSYGLFIYVILLVLSEQITVGLYNTVVTTVSGLLGTVFAFYYPSDD